MADVQLIPAVSGGFTIPAVDSFKAVITQGVRQLDNAYIANSFTGYHPVGSRSYQDPVLVPAEHVAALLALPEYDNRRIDFLEHVVHQGAAFVGFVEPSYVRLQNNTDRTFTLPAYSGYSAVTVPSKTSHVRTFAGHWTALAGHPEPAVQQARVFLTAWPVA